MTKRISRPCHLIAALLVVWIIPSTGALAEASPSKVVFVAAEGTKIRFDGEFLGRTPLEPILILPGSHRLIAKMPSGHEAREWIELRAGNATRVVVRAAEAGGS